HLAAGDVELAARACADDPGPAGPSQHQQYANDLRRLARARLLVAQSRSDTATPLLRELLDRAQRIGRRRMELAIRCVLAHATGDRAELGIAVALGEQLGALRSILDEGPALHAMLRRLPPSSYLARVLGATRPAAAP